MRIRRRVILAALSAAVGLWVLSGAAGAADGDIQCGDVITQDVTLHASLTGCTTAGLVIAADGVTVDLNGYSIEGAGADVASSGVEAFGVSGVRVRNGRIASFGTGVAVRGSESRIEALVITDTTTGILAFDPSPITKNVVSNNEISDSRNGITIFGGGDVIGNTVTDISARGAPWSWSSPTGIGIYCRGPGSSTQLVRDNEVVRADHVGIQLFFCGAELVSNQVSDNGLWGIFRERSGGPVERNRANGNGAGGIASSDSHGLFRENVTNANGGPGLSVHDQVMQHGPFHTITGNVANANAGLGIVTLLPDVVDGGKNRAHANGGSAQCLGVVCR